MNELTIFTYNDTPCRTIEHGGDIWWVLRDVCDALCIVDHKSIPRRLDEDEVDLIPLTDSLGREQNTYIINEPGLYNVILRSDKPEAKDFKRWVTHEVLPQIRRTGSYSVQPAKSANELILMMAQSNVEMERRVNELAAQNAVLVEQTAALSEKVDNAVKVFSHPNEDHWKQDTDKAIKNLCASYTLSTIATKGRMFDELETKAGCNIQSRLTALRKRMRKSGMTYRATMALTKLDAVSVDKHLRAIFDGIVREWQAKCLENNQRFFVDCEDDTRYNNDNHYYDGYNVDEDYTEVLK